MLYIFFLRIRGRSGTAATSTMERFAIIVNGWKPLTFVTKRSILDVAAKWVTNLGVGSNVFLKYIINNNTLNLLKRHQNNTRVYNLSSGPHIVHFMAVVAKKRKNFE